MARCILLIGDTIIFIELRVSLHSDDNISIKCIKYIRGLI